MPHIHFCYRVFTGYPELRISLLATGRFLTIFSTSVLRIPIRPRELKVLPIELALARAPESLL
jgi:hypothetical protein